MCVCFLVWGEVLWGFLHKGNALPDWAPSVGFAWRLPLPGEEILEVISPQRPRLYQRVMHLDGGGERLVGVVRAPDLRQEHPLERVKLSRHFLREIPEVGRLNDLQALQCTKWT